MNRLLKCMALSLPAVLGPLVATAQTTAPLNDTGQSRCYDATNTPVACTPAVAADKGKLPRQDARFGRDAQATAGTLTKTGGGTAGFDFTALDTTGAATAPGGHACVRDQVTSLIWSTQTLAGSWPDATAAASTYSRCGFGDGWRLPTRRELLSIVNHNQGSPAVDTVYFPDTTGAYWSSDAKAQAPAEAWAVDFGDGTTAIQAKNSQLVARFVTTEINHMPTITPGADIVLDRRDRPGPISLAGWATNITPGPARESGQHLRATLRLLPVTDQKGLEFDAPPTLDVATGTLSFTVKNTIYTCENGGIQRAQCNDPINYPNKRVLDEWYSSAGLARVEITLQDDGGTANGGVDTVTKTFTIFLDPRPLATNVSVKNDVRSPCVPITLGGFDIDTDPHDYSAWPSAILVSLPRWGFLTQFAAAAPTPLSGAGRPDAFASTATTLLSALVPAQPYYGTFAYSGALCYIPFVSTYTGSDTFTYALVDKDGNVSPEHFSPAFFGGSGVIQQGPGVVSIEIVCTSAYNCPTSEPALGKLAGENRNLPAVSSGPLTWDERRVFRGSERK